MWRVSVVNQIVVNDLGGSVMDIVHSLHPSHLVLRLERFGHVLTLCHLLYLPEKQFFCLPINVGKIAVQLAGSKQVVIQDAVMLFQIPPVSLSPYADVILFAFIRQC